MSQIVPKVPHIIYGGDYNPEQWPEEVWAEDARLMREAGVNLVALGVFAWAKIEPRPGVYDFAWLDRAMDLLHAHGVAVNLGTATAAPPPWLARLHPESLPVTADGVRLSHGSRRHYCPHSAAYRARAAALVERLAARYADHPALAMWHIDNEYGCHFAECFCDASAAAFRAWLRARYGSLDALNDAWGTTFWGQSYGEWDEIPAPRRAPYVHNPALTLDWRRFCSDSWLACFEDQRTILKHVTPDVPVMTNFMGLFKPLDYWAWAAREDVVANDTYPDPADPGSALDAALECDLMRSLGGGRPWLIAEQAAAHVSWRPRNATKPPGLMRLGSYRAIARGANGIMFFQWRASRAGGEQHHSAMLPHAGPDSRTFREVCALGGELRRLDAMLDTTLTAEAAILLDWQSWWALEADGRPTVGLTQAGQIRAAYEPLFHGNVAVDFARPDANLSRYKLVIAPSLYAVSAAAAANLERFVAEGGVLVVTCGSAIADEHGQIWTGGYPAPLRALLGLRISEYVPFGDGQRNSLRAADGLSFACHTWADVIETQGAETLARFDGDFYAGEAAITRHRFGQGAVYYLGACPDEAGMAWLLARACAEAGVRPALDAPEGVEVTRRTGRGRSFLVVLNRRVTPVELALPAPAHDLLSDERADIALHLPAYGVAVLEMQRIP